MCISQILSTYLSLTTTDITVYRHSHVPSWTIWHNYRQGAPFTLFARAGTELRPTRHQGPVSTRTNSNREPCQAKQSSFLPKHGVAQKYVLVSQRHSQDTIALVYSFLVKSDGNANKKFAFSTKQNNCDWLMTRQNSNFGLQQNSSLN